MPEIQPITPEEAEGEVQEIYQRLQKKSGKVFNIYQMMGNSPAVLGAYLALGEMAKKTELDAKLREKIALAVSEINRCGYCLAAHTATAKMLGVSLEETIAARKGDSDDPKTQAILHFARKVASDRGRIKEPDLAVLQNLGVSDRQILEIHLIVMQTTFSNYFNHIADTELDFPKAPEINASE